MKFITPLLLAFLLMGFTGPKKLTTARMYIPWSAERPVQWIDFQGKPISNSQEAAMTASSIEFSYESNGINLLRWQVQCKFFPELSWSKKDHQNGQILKHEQVHFDITEIYARLMRKRFLEEIHSIKDIPKFKPIVKEIMNDWNQEQNVYDSETKHSIHTAKQEEWNQAVAERLEELKDYTATNFEI